MNKMSYVFDSNYSQDFIKWIKIIEEKKLSIYNTSIIEQFQDEIIKTNNSAFAYFFAYEFPHNRHKMQKVIIDNNNYKYAYLFAQNIPNCDVRTLQNIVVSSNKINYICKFACFVKGAELPVLEKIILNSRSVKCAHMYINNIKCDIDKFIDIILKSKKPRYLYSLARCISDKNKLKEIEDYIIESKSFTYMRLFAEHIKSADVDRIEQIVLDSDNIDEIKKFARYVKRSKMKKFLLVS